MDSQDNATIIYDGECPLCKSYVSHLRLKKTVDVQLINARENKSILNNQELKHIDINQGMILILNGKIYSGDECVHILALLSTPSGSFNKFNYLIFKNKHLSKILYPLMRTGRNMLLKLLGIKKINHNNNIN